MLIKDAYRKNVIVTLKNNEKFKGFVFDLDLETDLGIYSIDESEIKSIKLIS
ncbi:MAG: hypothetical protein E7E61_02540 [Staphylococcus epidermidis]|nr:hypothetical protein [Staphylococcus epidermidis]